MKQNTRDNFTYDMYGIEISLVGSKYSIKPTSKNGVKCDTFFAPTTTGKKQKIYVITNGKDILYVGKTSQSMSSRLRGGMNITDPHFGYHGYKWIKDGERLSLHCFAMSDNVDEKTLEAIEAELVYNYRANTGKWPECQNEIHFFNTGEEAKEIAKQMYDKI